ncbi:MAG: hypothetical protein AAF757_25170 [Cyanobacteria bacterium P01_D01_bin.116]
MLGLMQCGIIISSYSIQQRQIYYQLPITNYQLPITNYQLPIFYKIFIRSVEGKVREKLEKN